jgi:hypothetical protein
MALNCFLKSAEPIKVYKVLVGAFVGNVGAFVGRQILKQLLEEASKYSSKCV